MILQDLPSQDAIQIANNLSNLGQFYNREDISTDVVVRSQIQKPKLIMLDRIWFKLWKIS